jgi:predicted enzyme related to lactoylglutathione lyase
MPEITGIGAIMIYANDPGRLSRWYDEVLGLGTIRDLNDGNYYGDVVDQRIDKTIHFGIYGALEPLAGNTHAVMVNFRFDDLPGLEERLAQRGIAIESTIEDMHGRFVYIRDPEGNPLELWSEPLR